MIIISTQDGNLRVVAYTEAALPDVTWWRGVVTVENPDQEPLSPTTFWSRLEKTIFGPKKGAFITHFRFRGVGFFESRERAESAWLIFKDILRSDTRWYQKFEVERHLSYRYRYMPVPDEKKEAIRKLLGNLTLPEQL